MKKTIDKLREIKFNVCEDDYQKYILNKECCVRAFINNIDYVNNNSKISKIIQTDKTDSHGLIQKLKSEILGVILQLDSLKDFHLKNGPFKQNGELNNNFVETNYTTIINAIWNSILCQINVIREMLNISGNSTNIDHITLSNPFVIWRVMFFSKRHYKMRGKIIPLNTEKNKIYTKINQQARLETKDKNIQTLLRKMYQNYIKETPNLDANQIELYMEQFGISKTNAQTLWSKVKNNQIQFNLPSILPNQLNKELNSHFDNWMNLLINFWYFLFKKINLGQLDDIFSNKEKLWIIYLNDKNSKNN